MLMATLTARAAESRVGKSPVPSPILYWGRRGREAEGRLSWAGQGSPNFPPLQMCPFPTPAPGVSCSRGGNQQQRLRIGTVDQTVEPLLNCPSGRGPARAEQVSPLWVSLSLSLLYHSANHCPPACSYLYSWGTAKATNENLIGRLTVEICEWLVKTRTLN